MVHYLARHFQRRLGQRTNLKHVNRELVDVFAAQKRLDDQLEARVYLRCQHFRSDLLSDPLPRNLKQTLTILDPHASMHDLWLSCYSVLSDSGT